VEFDANKLKKSSSLSGEYKKIQLGQSGNFIQVEGQIYLKSAKNENYGPFKPTLFMASNVNKGDRQRRVNLREEYLSILQSLKAEGKTVKEATGQVAVQPKIKVTPSPSLGSGSICLGMGNIGQPSLTPLPLQVSSIVGSLPVLPYSLSTAGLSGKVVLVGNALALDLNSLKPVLDPHNQYPKKLHITLRYFQDQKKAQKAQIIAQQVISRFVPGKTHISFDLVPWGAKSDKVKGDLEDLVEEVRKELTKNNLDPSGTDRPPHLERRI
jgi:hypothetical protein